MILKNLIYGIVSGMSEFLPVSSLGHQSLLRVLFGISARDPLLDLCVHIALLAAVLFSCRNTLDAYKKDYMMLSRRGRTRRSAAGISRTYELRMLLTATIPMLAIMIIFSNRNDVHLLWLGVSFIINGVILFVPDYLMQSNKDAGKMAGIDGILAGVFYGLSVIPGISAIGSGLSVTIARGADKTHAYNWMLLLTIPAAVILCFFDLIAVFSSAGLAVTFLTILSYLLAMIGAFVAACFAIMLMRFLMHHIGNSGFAYYSWGIAMLIFMLYLIS